MKNLRISMVALITASIFWSCSEDTTTSAPPADQCGKNVRPNIDIKVGQVHRYTNDSLTASGPPSRTRIVTTDSVLRKGTFFGRNNVVQVSSISRDTVNQVIYDRDTIYAQYDDGAAVFWQYGLVKLIDSTQTPEWNKVADFSVPFCTPYQIANFNTTIGVITFNVDLKGQVDQETSVQTTGSPGQSILCYRIKMTAAVTIPGPPPIPVTNIYIYYYLGYSPVSPSGNPSGMVRLRTEPFSIYSQPYPGFDRTLQRFAIP